MNIRPRTPADDDAIDALTREAFGASPHGHHGEAALVRRLRADGDAVIELVALKEGEIAGHVMLSAMQEPSGALALAPLSTEPGRWQRGIGSMLMDAAIARAAGLSIPMIFLLGDPAYYGRFGFNAEAAAGFESPYAGKAFQALRLQRNAPTSGRACYPEAFSNTN